jgi:vacuolar-type H+-ATPase subunit H
LLLAQKFVDQTEAEAETQARTVLAEAETRAHAMLSDAETRARSLTEETERHLREDISRLESIRTQLAGDVETIARHLDTERNRLRAALGDMLTWVDEHVQPTASLLAQPSATASTPASGSTPSAGASAHESSARSESDAENRSAAGQPPRPAPPGQPGQTVVGTPAGSRISEGAGTSPGDRQGTMPLPDSEDARTGVPR